MTTKAGEIDGHAITVLDNWQFEVTGPFVLEKESARFGSHSEAVAFINARIAAKEKEERVGLKLRLPVLNGAGALCVIKGIHASRGHILGVNEVEIGNHNFRVRDNDAYPVTERLKTLLDERRRIVERLAEITGTLRQFKIDRSRSYHIGSANYDSLIESLVAEHAAQLAKAESAEKQLQAKAQGSVAKAGEDGPDTYGWDCGIAP